MGVVIQSTFITSCQRINSCRIFETLQNETNLRIEIQYLVSWLLHVVYIMFAYLKHQESVFVLIRKDIRSYLS